MKEHDLSICFITNYLTHHQLPFCIEMQTITKGKFKLIETDNLPKERIKLGYKNLGEQFDFVINATQNEGLKQEALRVAEQCDVAIIGSAPDIYMKERMKKNKLTFRCAERIFKQGRNDVLRRIKHTIKNYPYRNKELYYLLNSAYAAKDFVICGARQEKMFMWGYFPEFIEYDIKQLLSNKEETSILWVGRLIEWKHPDISIRIAERLKEEGYQFKLTIIGTGEMEKILQEMIREKNLSDCVSMIGAIPAEKVRDYMEKSQIFLFTSDQNEGWGAVVNEAMNSGCVVIANVAAGAVPCMIINEKNGLVYNDDENIFYTAVKKLLESDKLRENLGIASYETIRVQWNARNATQRLCTLITAIQNKEENPYSDGIVGPAMYI